MSSDDIARDSNDVDDVQPPSGPPLPPEMPIYNRPKPVTSHPIAPAYLSEHLWASAYPDVQKACYLARVCPIVSPKSCRLKNIPSIIQEGPTCGLAALSMLGLGEPSPEQLLQSAREMGFTRNGEMFSADNLLKLLRSRKSGGLVVEDEVHLCDGRLDCDQLKQALINGGCLLVPYDADFNHGPCLRKGHKAHWALIIGYLIDDDDQFFVFARHGKTKNVAVWTLAALSASNANLTEFEQPKAHPNAQFELPEGGVGGALGLREKCIIIPNLSADIDDIVVR